MEISLEAIISLLGLFVGGGGGAFFMWKWQKRKAKAEAESAEIDAAKDLQDMYQQMLEDSKADREDRKSQMEELRQERDHYKQERNELRDEIGRLSEEMRDWKRKSEDERDGLKRDVARLGRRVDAMTPFMCADLSCQLRKRVAQSDIAGADVEPHPIDPIDMNDM